MDDRVEYPCAQCEATNRIPRERLHDNPICGKCKESVFPAQPVVVSDSTWRQEVEACPIPVLVDFWAPWCGPCKVVAPALERIAAERKGRLKIVKLNVDENPRTQTLNGIQSIPTFLLKRGPLIVDREVGALSKEALDLWIDRYI